MGGRIAWMEPAHTLLCVFSCKDMGRESRRWALLHLKNWSTWAGTDKKVKIGTNRNGTKKDDKRTENVNNTFKQIGVRILHKAGKLLILVVT